MYMQVLHTQHEQHKAGYTNSKFMLHYYRHLWRSAFIGFVQVELLWILFVQQWHFNIWLFLRISVFYSLFSSTVLSRVFQKLKVDDKNSLFRYKFSSISTCFGSFWIIQVYQLLYFVPDCTHSVSMTFAPLSCIFISGEQTHSIFKIINYFYLSPCPKNKYFKKAGKLIIKYQAQCLNKLLTYLLKPWAYLGIFYFLFSKVRYHIMLLI